MDRRSEADSRAAPKSAELDGLAVTLELNPAEDNTGATSVRAGLAAASRARRSAISY